MKGILAPRSIGTKLLVLFLLSIVGYIFFSGLGLALASSAYNITIENISDLLTEPSSGNVLRTVQGFATVGIFLFPAILASYLFSEKPQRLMGLNAFPKPAWLIVILLVALAYSSGVISDALYQFSDRLVWPKSLEWLENYFAQTEELMTQQYESLLQMNSFTEFLQVLTVMALLPAVAEEAMFRGVLQPLLIKGSGRHFGIVLTSLIFALLHQQFQVLLAIFVLGLVLGYLREWTKSLWVPTLVHFINNGSIVVMVYYFNLDYADPTANSQMDQPTILISLLVVFIASLGAVYWLTNKERKKSLEQD